MSQQPKPIIPDHILLKEWEEGSESALRQLYERYYEPAVVYGISLTKNRCLAEDIAQKTFLQIIKKVKSKKGKPITDFKPYLFTSVKNKCLDHFRRRPNLPIEEIPPDKVPFADFPTYFEEDDFREKIFTLILSEDEKEVYELKKQDYNDADVAKRLTKTEGQVRGLSHRAKQKLKKYRMEIEDELFGL